MNTCTENNIYYLPHLRECQSVFLDRTHAGRCISDMIKESDAVVMGIPAGGIPVAAVVARALGFKLDVAVVSKITLPWNTEAGYGAVAFDGSLLLNEALIRQSGLSRDQVQAGIDKTRIKVAERVRRLRGGKPMTDLSGKTVIVVDDGLASGYTMRVAVEALARCGAVQMIVAVPTGHAAAVDEIARQVHALYCPNIRSSPRFAVADAYENWTDVSESEAETVLKTVDTVPPAETCA
ncbi:MAG: phosphoribosyltransferase family protein [Desulfobacterales bacterium]